MEKASPEKTTGLIIGKFLPPHLGHQYLVDFARHYVTDLTVQVCTLARESIPGCLRFQWMREMFPGVRVIHNPDENPQEPHEHQDFWNIWRTSIQKRTTGTDFLFASETYGERLAEVLGARFVPVNIDRSLVPVSGSQVRTNPLANWRFIPPAVRPFFVKKVCIVGPESAGKSTLAKDLATHFQTVYVHEYARSLLETRNNTCRYEDIPDIARGHVAAEEALARQANRLLVCDTDPMTTVLWSEFFFQKCPEWIIEMGRTRRYDLHLLCAADVPWCDDPQRFQPRDRERRAFFDRCREELDKAGRPFVVIRGSWEERFRLAVQAIQDILTEPGGA